MYQLCLMWINLCYLVLQTVQQREDLKELAECVCHVLLHHLPANSQPYQCH